MPAPIPVRIPDTFFGYQFHQVAMFVPGGMADLTQAVEHWCALGYENWILDEAVLKGKLDGEDVLTAATMMFNYDIMPMELEFLHYDGPSRHASQQRLSEAGLAIDPYISHMSVYVEDVIWETHAFMGKIGRAPYHRFITTEHTNPGVVGKKRFIESIFDTKALLGYDTKFIQKVEWDYPDEAWLGQVF